MKKRIFLIFLVLTTVFLINLPLFAGRGGGGGGYSRRSSGSSRSSRRSYSGGRSSRRSYSGGRSSRRSYSGGRSSRRSSRSYGYRSYRGYGGRYSSSSINPGVAVIVIALIVGIFLLKVFISKKGSSKGGNAFHMQLGFYLGNGSLQKELENIVKSSDTSMHSGLVYLLRESSLILAQNQDNIRWFDYKKKSCSNDEDLENTFRTWETEERMKIEKIELSNQDGHKRGDGNQSDNLEEIFVVNIFAASYKRLSLESKANFQESINLLKFFASLSEDQVAGTSVWWQILDNDETLVDYPNLRSV